MEYSEFPEEITKLSWCYYGGISSLEFINEKWNTKYWEKRKKKKIED